MVEQREDEAARLPAGAMTVASVARRLGVAPSTLRTWDRRYGLGPRDHSSGAHRRYCPEDVARLLVMRRLTLEGLSPAEAARIAASDSLQTTMHTHRTLRDAAEPDDHAAPLDVDVTTPAARGLTRAAMALDFAEMSQMVRRALREEGLDRMWHQMVLPALTRIGERWRASGEGVEAEHALTQVVVSTLHAERPVPRHVVNSRPVLLACVEGEQHTLPLNVLEYVLAERGVVCRTLGQGMPRQALVDATRRIGPAAVFLFAQLDTRDELLLAELPRQRPAPRIVLGGTGWRTCEVPAGMPQVNTLGDAVDALLSAVHV